MQLGVGSTNEADYCYGLLTWMPRSSLTRRQPSWLKLSEVHYWIALYNSRATQVVRYPYIHDVLPN